MKQFKRALAMLLALSMVLALCPVMAAEPEEDGMLFLSGADVSTIDEPEGGSEENAPPEEYIFVYSQAEFEAALLEDVYEIDIMEGTHIVLSNDVVTDKMIYVDAGASLTVPEEYTLTLTGADGLALEMASLQAAEAYELPENIVSDAPVLMMFTEVDISVDDDITLDSGKLLGIFNNVRLDLDDDVLVEIRNPILFASDSGYFQACIGDDDSLVTLEDPDTEERIRYLCGNVDLVQTVLDEHPDWIVSQLTIGAVGDDNVLTLVDDADNDPTTLFLGERIPESVYFMCETKLVLAEGVDLTVNELALFRYWDTEHTDSVLLELEANASITVTGETFIRGNISYDPSADLDFRGADLTTRYPHLEADWLMEWDSDEEGPLWGESENPQSEIWLTALEEPCLIFFAEYFYEDAWHYEPVIPEIDGVEMWDISDRAARGEYNDWAFVQLAGLEWGQEYSVRWEAPDGNQLTMPIYVELPGLGFYTHNEICYENYINGLSYTPWDAYSGQDLTVWMGHVDQDLPVQDVEWIVHDNGEQDADGYILVGDRDKETGLYPMTINADLMQTCTHFSVQVRYIMEEDWVEETWLHIYAQDMSIWVDKENIVLDEDGNLCQIPYSAELGTNHLALAKDETRTGMLYFVFYDDQTDRWVCDPYGPEWFRDDMGLVGIEYQDEDQPYPLTITGVQFGESQLVWKNGWMDENGDWLPNDDDWDDCGALNVEVGGLPGYVDTVDDLIARAENGVKELLLINADMTLTQDLKTDDTICFGVNEDMDYAYKLTLDEGAALHTTGGLELVVESLPELKHALSDSVTSGEDKYIYVRGAFTLDEMTVPQGTNVLVMKGADLRVADGKKVTFLNGSMGFAHTNLQGEVTVPLHAKCSVFADVIYYKADEDGNWTDAFRVLYGDVKALADDLAEKVADGWQVWNLILSAATEDNTPGVVTLTHDLSNIYLENLLIQDGSQLVLQSDAAIRAGWLDITQVWEDHDTYSDVLLVLEDGASLLTDGGYILGSGQWSGKAEVRLGQLEFEGHWPHLAAKWVYFDEETQSWQIDGDYEHHCYSVPDAEHNLAFFTAVWDEETQDYTYTSVSDADAPVVYAPDGSYTAQVKVLETDSKTDSNYRQVEMYEFGTYVAVYSDGETFSGSMPLTNGLPELGFFRYPERSFENYLGADGAWFLYGENGDWSNEFYIDLAGDASFEIVNWWTDEGQDWYHIEDMGNQMWKVVLHENFTNDPGMRDMVRFGFTMRSKDESWPDRDQEITAMAHHMSNIVSYVNDAEGLVLAAQSGTGRICLNQDITLSASDLPEEMNSILRVNAVLDFASHDAHLTLEDDVVLQMLQWPEWGEDQDAISRIDFGMASLNLIPYENDRPCLIYFAKGVSDDALGGYMSRLAADGGLQMVSVITDSFDEAKPFTLTMNNAWPELDLETVELFDNAALVLEDGAVLQVDHLYVHDSGIDYEQMAEYQRQEASKLLVDVRSGATLQVRNELNVDGHLNWTPDANVQFDCNIQAAGYWPRLEHTWLDGSETGFVERGVTDHENYNNGGNLLYDYNDWNECNTSLEENRIFFIRYLGEDGWAQIPVFPAFTIDGMDAPEGFMTSLEAEAAEGQDNASYFVRYSMEDWNRTYTATGTGAGYTLSVNFRTGLSDVGFYSQPEVREEYAINELALSPVEDNVFYMGFDINADQTYYVEDVVLNNAEDGLITMEKLPSGMYKVTISAAKARALDHAGAQADFSVIMTHGNFDQEGNLEAWTHDYSIGISTHNAVVFSASKHLTESVKLDNALLSELQTELKLEAGQSVTGSLYQVEYLENETDPGWYVQPFAADWFVGYNSNGHFEAADADQTRITADGSGLYQIYRATAEPDDEDGWLPTGEHDWWVLPLDVIISGESTDAPYLTMGWLQEHWRWDEAAEQDVVSFTEDRLNGHYEGFTMTPGQVFNLIFYLHYYDADACRWVVEPVSVTAKNDSSITLESLSEQAVAGQVNKDKFIAVDASEADWGNAITLVGTSADRSISAEMVVDIALPGHGFYSAPEMITANYLPEFVLDPLTRDYVFYFGCINKGETLTINDYDDHSMIVEPVADVPNLYKVTLAESFAQLAPWEEYWANLYWTTSGNKDDYLYTGETGIRCSMPQIVEVSTKEQLKSASDSGVEEIKLINDIKLNDLVIVYDKDLNLNGNTLTLSGNGALAVDRMPLTGHETGEEEHPDITPVMKQIDSIGAVVYEDGKICWNSSLQQMLEDIHYRIAVDGFAPHQLFMDDTAQPQTLVIDQNWAELHLADLMLSPGWSLEVTDGAQVNTERFVADSADPDSYDPDADTALRVQVSNDAYLGIHERAQVWGHINWTSGGHIDLPEDFMQIGQMPELVFYWLDCDENGWFVRENERNDGFGSTPLDMHRAVFFAKVWENGQWVEHPVAATDSMNRSTIFRSLYEYEEDVRFANADDPTNEYFVVLDCNYAGWDEERTISADWNGTYVEMGAYFGYGDNGFFREPQASPEHYLPHYTMTREGENSFYFILDADHEQLEGVYNLSFNEEGNEIWNDLPGWDKVDVKSTADPNVWKITIKEDTDRMESFHFELYFKTYQLDDQGNKATDEDGKDIIHGRHHVGIYVEAADVGETLAILRINNEDYHVTESGVIRYTETGSDLRTSLADFFEGTVDYDVEHNTLTLENANLSKLELGYGWDEEIFLPGQDLRIQVNRINTIANTEDHAVILHDNIKAIFQGDGTLNVAVSNADDFDNPDDNGTFDAFVVNNAELVLNEGVTVNIEADGSGYQYHNPDDGDPWDTNGWNSEDGYFYENGEKAPCHIRALVSHEGGAVLYVQSGATLNAAVPAVGRFNGIEGFDSIVVRDAGSALTTQSIRFYGENNYLDVYDGASATVTGVEECYDGVNYDIGTISMDNGYIKVYNNGKLTVVTDAFSSPDVEKANYHVSGIVVGNGGFLMGGSETAVTIDLDASLGWSDGLHVGSGEIRVNDGLLDVSITGGIAVCAGENPHEGNPNPETILNHNGGTVKIRTGEQEEDATAYQISYGSTANFNGTSVNDIRAFRALSNLGTVNFREDTQFNAEATQWAYEYGLVVNEPAWNEYGRSSTLNIYGGTLNLSNRSGLTGRQDDEGNAITVSSVLNNCNDFIMTGGTVNILACEAVFTGIDCCGVNLISGGTINIGSAKGDRPQTGINVWPDGNLPNNYLRLTGGTINTHGNRRGAIIQTDTYLQGGIFDATAYVDDGVGAMVWLGETDYDVTVTGGTHTFTAPETPRGIGLYSMMVPIVVSGGSVTAKAGNAVISYYELEGDHQNDPTFYNMFTLSSDIHAVSNTSGKELKFIEYKNISNENDYLCTYYEAWLDNDNEDKTAEDGTPPAYTAKSVTFSTKAGTQDPIVPDPTPETVVLSTLEVTSSRMTVGAPVSLRASVTVEQGGTVTFTLPDALELVEKSVAVNNEQVAVVGENTFTLTLEGSAVITFQVIPQEEGTFNIYGLVTENDTHKTSNCNALLSVSSFKMSAPTYTSSKMIQVSGAAQSGETVILSVRYKNAEGQDDTKTISGIASALGTYTIDVELPIIDSAVAQTFTIDAYLHSIQDGQPSVGTTTVVYNPEICEIQYLEITNQIHGNSEGEILDVKNRIDFTTGTGVPDRSFYTYWPELNGFDFTATFANPNDQSNDQAINWKIDWVRVDVTYRNGRSSSFYLEEDANDPFRWEITDALVINAPVDFSVIYACSAEGSTPIVIDPGVIPIIPIMDPSGTVMLNGTPLEGATVTIYSGGDGTEPDDSDLVSSKAYPTTNLLQVNPQITDKSGGFHWDVPEGWWKVVAVKDGQQVESEWLQVLPIHTDLILEFSPGAKVKDDTEFVKSSTMKIPVMVSFSSRNDLKPAVIAAIYDANGRMISMDMQSVSGVGEVTLTVDNSQDEAAEIRTFLVSDLNTFTPLYPSQSYSKK